VTKVFIKDIRSLGNFVLFTFQNTDEHSTYPI